MSTLMIDSMATQRLTHQFEAVLRRGGPRDAMLEARRFIAYLCDRLERNNRAMMAAVRKDTPQRAVGAGYAARQGDSVQLTCLFLMHDLTARIGRRRMTEFLTATGTRAGRALARRITARPTDQLRISSVRFVPAEGSERSREYVAELAPFAGTNAVSALYEFQSRYPGVLRLGLVLENDGSHTAHFAAAHLRLYARYGVREPWQSSPGSAFAFLDRVAVMESQVMALRGFDCMEMLRGVDARNRDPVALKVLARLV
jgi:hypothetical protein